MEFIHNKLITKKGETEFQYKILDVKYHSKLYIVMLNIPNSVEEVDNVYGVDENGTIIWRIESPIKAFAISSNTKGYDYYRKSTYVGFLDSDDNFLRVVTFSGMKYKLNCENGKLLEIESSRW